MNSSVDFKYRADIDGLRAIAVFAVIANHAGIAGFNGGFVGVDVFFVISGYLITGLLTKEIQKTGKISFLNFYAKRIRRLYPALLFLLLSVAVLWSIFFLGVKADTINFSQSIGYSTFGLANIFFKNVTGGYFGSDSLEMPLLHLWSLGVEEQFYLFWPLLILFAHQAKKFESRLFQLLLVIAIASLCVSQFFLSRDSSISFYWMPPRAWKLSLGAVLVLIGSRLDQWLKSLGNFFLEFVALLGLLMIGASIALYSSSTRFPGTMALIPTFGAFFIILAGRFSYRPQVSRLLSTKLFVRVGLLSYGWYLWHWPLLAMSRLYHLGSLPSFGWRLLLVGISFLLSVISLYWIETPLRGGPLLKKVTSFRILLGALILSLSILAIAWGLPRLEQKYISPRWESYSQLVAERSSLASHCFSTTEILPFGPCTVSFAPDLSQNTPEIAIWGDSHADAYFPMVEQYAKSKKIKASEYVFGNTPPLLNVPGLSRGSPKTTALFNTFNERVLKDLQRKSKASHKLSVILVGSWVRNSGVPPYAFPYNTGFLDEGDTHEGTLNVLRDSLSKTLSELTKSGVSRVLILLPYPEFKFEPLRCYQRNPDLCFTPRAVIEDYRKEVLALIKEVSASFPIARTLDPVPFLCGDEICPQMIRTQDSFIPVTYDTNHPSSAAARLVGDHFKDDLDWLTNQK